MPTRGYRAAEESDQPQPAAKISTDGSPASYLARRARRVGLLLLILALVVPACSDATKRRLLDFFFDGVPDPGAIKQVGYAPLVGSGRRVFQAPENQPAPEVAAYTHSPYRTGDCGGCHDPTSGGVVRTTQEGLCRSCHPGIPGGARYVHGPVAVQDCLFCHHPHGSMQPKVLLAEATELCLRCHDRADLGDEPHHRALEQSSCIDCHDAHSGDNRFFLKRRDR